MRYLRIPAAAVAALFVLGATLGARTASAQNSQQARTRQCNTDARAHGLSGRARQSFMQTCLSRPSGRNVAQRNARTCTQQARARGLTGSAQRRFVERCLR